MNGPLTFMVAAVLVLMSGSVINTKMRLERNLTRADGLLVLVAASGIVLAVALAWAGMA